MLNKERGLGLVYCCCIPACICSQARDYQLSGSVFTKLGLILSDEDVSRPYTALPVPATPASTRCYTLPALSICRFTEIYHLYDILYYIFISNDSFYIWIHFEGRLLMWRDVATAFYLKSRSKDKTL